MGISVVICCYNSSSRLAETLSYLSRQIANVDWELVLVDNASTDNTSKLAEELWNRSGNVVPLKITSEPRPGLSFARETGIRNTTHDIIVFCDDDNWLAQDYLQNAYDIMMSDKQIGICGGIGEAVFDGNSKPDWFDKYQLVFACGRQSDKEGVQGIEQLSLYGAGMTVRREIFKVLEEQNYVFNLTGRKGNKVIAGEDFELAVLARALGYKIFYTEKLKFKHYMPSTRMQWEYLVNTVRGSALSSAVAFVYSDVLRYKITGESRYRVNWFKDILKAMNAARLVKVTKIRDLGVVWARLSGGLSSVVSNAFKYKHYQKQIEQAYDTAHKTD